jgi:hypothetical protein
VLEYTRRGDHIVAYPVTDGVWLTIGDPINYLKTVIKYVIDDALNARCDRAERR